MFLVTVLISAVAITKNSYGVSAGSADFVEIHKSSGFVDKTILIKEFLDNARSLVVAAPNGFGKSANLDMVRLFLSNSVDKKKAEEAFKYTTISKEEAFIKTHLGSYPVIHCSFKPDSPVTDYNSMVKGFRTILQQTFLEHKYLADSGKLTKYDLTELKSYMNKEEQLKPIQISVGLYFLSQILEKHYNKQVILLIDDYDYVIIDSMFTKGLDVTQVLGFYNAILSAALFHNEHVNMTILAGTTCVSMKPLVDLQAEGIQCVKFLEEKNFEPFFGLTEQEVDELLSREAFKGLQEKKPEVTMWYDGYTGPDLRAHAYRTSSVLSFLNSGEVKCYLDTTRGGNAFKVLLQERVTSKLFSESSQKVIIVVRSLEEVDQTLMQGLKNMMLNEIWDEDYSDLYIHLLMEKGYFTFDTPWQRSGYNSSVTVKFPNIEVCEAVRQMVSATEEAAKQRMRNRNIQ